jgi:hypothetical protein
VAGRLKVERGNTKAPASRGPVAKPKKKATTKRKSIVESATSAEEEAVLKAAGAQPEQPLVREREKIADQQQTAISTSRGFLDWLATHRMSLALTSYQTGQLLLIGPLANGRLSVFQRNFVRAMGLWASPQRIYLSTIAHIWRLENVLGPGQSAKHRAHQYQRLYVPRDAHTTGDLDLHEMTVDSEGRLIFVNTKYSCLATTDPVHSFRPLWKPSFISKLAPEDRCHLNGLCLQNGKPKYVTAVSRSDLVDRFRASSAAKSSGSLYRLLHRPKQRRWIKDRKRRFDAVARGICRTRIKPSALPASASLIVKSEDHSVSVHRFGGSSKDAVVSAAVHPNCEAYDTHHSESA